jgi:Immunity protein 27
VRVHNFYFKGKGRASTIKQLGSQDTEMRVIEIDGSELVTPLDVYRVLGDAVSGGKDVTNVNALLEYMVWDWEGMGGIEPPYIVRVVNAPDIPTEVTEEIALIASLVKESQGGHLQVVLEWPPGALLQSPEERLHASETDLIGSWIKTGSGLASDSIEQRIEWLIGNYLRKVAKTSDGWDVLYRDPNDGRYWELTFPRGPIHGGGPRRLTSIADVDARHKYALVE